MKLKAEKEYQGRCLVWDPNKTVTAFSRGLRAERQSERVAPPAAAGFRSAYTAVSREGLTLRIADKARRQMFFF